MKGMKIMIRNNDSFVTLSNSKNLIADNIPTYYSRYNTSIFDGNKLKGNVIKGMKVAVKNLTDPVLKRKLSKTLLTTNINDIRELLSDTFIMSCIHSGREGTEKLLMPLLYEYFNCVEITKQEKTEMVKTLRTCYNKNKEMCLNDFDLQRQAVSKSGIDYFYANVNNIIKPYKLF
jgi:hypothetical protein